MPSATSRTVPISTDRTASKPSALTTAGLLLAAIVVASLADAVIAVIARAAGASDDFQALKAPAFISLTMIGVLAGAAGWAAVRRRSRQPRTLLRRLVPAVLVVSFVPDLVLLFDHYRPHANTAGVLGLLAMHVAVATVAVTTYLRALPVTDPPA
jgi:hypothetical protein